MHRHRDPSIVLRSEANVLLKYRVIANPQIEAAGFKGLTNHCQVNGYVVADEFYGNLALHCIPVGDGAGLIQGFCIGCRRVYA